MKRVVLSSSRFVGAAATAASSSAAAACTQRPPQPWRVLQCHTWHTSHLRTPQSQGPTLPAFTGPSLQSQTPTFPALLPFFQGKASGINPNEEEGQTPADILWPLHSPSISLKPSISQLKKYNTTKTVEVENAKRILQLSHLLTVKHKLQTGNQEVMAYSDLLKMCISIGVASSQNDAIELVKCLDGANLVLILQDTVYLNPQKVIELINKVVPKPSPTINGREHIVQEIRKLKEEKEDIDKLANKHSRKILWLGFGYLTLQMLLIFRLTFWELSWDVMEPIAYFVTNITLLMGYGFFMITSKHPTYRNLGAILSSSKQRKLMKRRNFNMAKLLKLEAQCDSDYNALKSTISC